jgi:hypothetical protein
MVWNQYKRLGKIKMFLQLSLNAREVKASLMETILGCRIRDQFSTAVKAAAFSNRKSSEYCEYHMGESGINALSILRRAYETPSVELTAR